MLERYQIKVAWLVQADMLCRLLRCYNAVEENCCQACSWLSMSVTVEVVT